MELDLGLGLDLYQLVNIELGCGLVASQLVGSQWRFIIFAAGHQMTIKLNQ